MLCFRGIYQLIFIAFGEDVFKDLFEKVGIFKAAGVILPKGREMGDRIQHIQTEEPAVGDIDLDLFDGLPHAAYPVQVLDERYLDQRDWVHARTPEIRRILIFDKFIDKCPVDSFIDQPQEMVFRDQIVHAEHLVLFPFFIRILCHHGKIPPWI